MRSTDRLMLAIDSRGAVLQTALGDVQVAREGHGPPVLAIHGGPGGFDQGLAYCRHLRDGGCELLALSRPGYLRTPLSSGRRPESQADLYAAILDELNIERAAVLGFSSGGPSAVHFAARHPDRTSALLLDTAILLPFEPPLSSLERASYESAFLVWLTLRIVAMAPKLMTRVMIRGASDNLSREQKQEAVDWITCDPSRLRSVQEQFASVAPRKHRAEGWANDKSNEANLVPLPFADVAAPALIAHGINDAIVPIEHATHAVERVATAELALVKEGHHLLSVSRNYAPVAQRQLEMVHG